MKYMLIMRTTDEALAASADLDFAEIIEAMGKYNESLIKAGVLAGGDGLAPAEEGVVVDFSSETPLVTDGPYGETKELFNGFWILDVASQEEAVEWAKRAPLGAGDKLEVRRIPGIEDFPQDNEWIQKEKQWREDAAWTGEA
ncbi:YciI family protein [Microbacterium tumbae]